MAELTDKQQALLEELLKNFKGDARDIFGEGGLLKTIGKRALEAALEGELTHHLGYPAHDRSGRGSGNSRNGRTAKRLECESGLPKPYLIPAWNPAPFPAGSLTP